MAELLEAMSEWEIHTCVRFVRRTDEDDYVNVTVLPCEYAYAERSSLVSFYNFLESQYSRF